MTNSQHANVETSKDHILFVNHDRPFERSQFHQRQDMKMAIGQPDPDEIGYMKAVM
jgi:hypothetical protein